LGQANGGRCRQRGVIHGQGDYTHEWEQLLSHPIVGARPGHLLHGEDVKVTQKDKQRGWLSEKSYKMAGSRKSELSEGEYSNTVC